ncbi:YveK family protein [Paenibacillus tarimensis]
MELKQYWNIVKKRLWIIMLLAVVFGTVTGFYSYSFIKPQYAASTKLIVNQSNGTGDILDRLDLGSINSSIQLLKTYKEIIRTPKIMNQVVEEYPQLGVTAGDLIRRVSVSSVNDTQVMSVTVIDSDYERAARSANAISIVFQKAIPELMKVDNISILDEANPNSTPVYISPNPVKNIVVSIILAVLLGLGLVFLIEYLDDTIKTEEDVTRILQLPTLSAIPKIKVRDMKRYKERITDEPLRSGKNVTFEA